MKFSDLIRFVLPVAFLRLNFGGGGGDSTQSSATTTTNTTNVQDNRTVADAGAIVAGAGATVNQTVTDLGAIKAGTDLAEQAILGATKLATEASAKAGSLSVAALDLTKGAVTELKGAYEASGKQVAVYALLFVVGIGFLAMQGNKK